MINFAKLVGGCAHTYAVVGTYTWHADVRISEIAKLRDAYVIVKIKGRIYYAAELTDRLRGGRKRRRVETRENFGGLSKSRRVFLSDIISPSTPPAKRL